MAGNEQGRSLFWPADEISVRGRRNRVKQSMGARNRVGIGLSYPPARLPRLAEFIPWNQFLGSIVVYKYGLWRSRRAWDQNIYWLVPHKTRGNKIGLRDSKVRRTGEQKGQEGIRGTKFNITRGWDDQKKRTNPEPEFLYFYGAQESIPRGQFRQPM